MPTSRRKSSTASSKTPESPKKDESVLVLGDRLVKELERSIRVDSLARWMAHYLAELITTARHADGAVKAEAESSAARLILSLWEHRDHLSTQSRPFRNYEGLLRVLESIDPESAKPRFFFAHEDLDPEQLAADSHWFRAIRSLDQATRVLTRYCLDRFLTEMPAGDQDWIKLVQTSELPPSLAITAYRALLSGAKPETDLAGKEDAKRETALAALVELEGLTSLIAVDLEERLRGKANIERRPQRVKAKKVTASKRR